MKRMYLNAFTQACIGHHSEGQWKNPLHRVRTGYRNLHYWTHLAQTLERGCFDTLFLADVHGTYSVYRGSNRVAISQGVQFPGMDPTLLIPAMAAFTQHLGFACTYSTSYFPPYHTAKLFSTLDHLTNGRVAWNIVTSYLADALANFGISDTLSHDERYDRADEYMDVVYKLWERSWEDDAFVCDAARDLLVDPDKVHTIDHAGRYFDVKGPHMCEPSPQRTPVLFQAGASGRGHGFAGKHAEAVFMVAPTIAAAAEDVRKLRAAAVAAGRQADDIRINQGVAVVVAPTDEEARVRERTLRSYASPEAVLSLFCGWTGIDLSTVPPGKPVGTIESKAIQSMQNYFARFDAAREWTLESMADFMAIGSIMPKIIGSPTTVADQLEEWIERTGLDGFNLHAVPQPTGFEDFVNLVVPELQRRGLVRTAYEDGTLRERLFGAGHRRLSERHPGRRVDIGSGSAAARSAK